MELMAELRPKFIRLPGGNYLEGSRFADRFNWKQMIGPADQRPGHMAPWGYRSSDGFGLPEYLLWCKQLGAEPVLGLFAGYVLNGDHFKAGSPEMALYTQEALEEIEYVSGPADSDWGKKRAADGFPEPFPLHYVEIGNEDWFDRSGSYDGRFTQMARAIRERYPHLKIIASAPVKSFKPDLYDDHFYRSASQLMRMATMYDPPTAAAPPLTFAGGGWNGRQRDGILTFVGEWATQEGRPTPTLNAALADAAFVMGLEKNSDAVVMECYAPLFVNVNPADTAKGYPKAWQWNTNLIGYDALRSFGSPSYYAQVMLAQNKGDVVLPLKLDVPGEASSSVFATATFDKAERTVIVKVVNAGTTPFDTIVNVRGVDRVEPTATAVVLAGDPTAVNTLDEPRKVAPKQETVAGASTSFRHTFPPHSFTILRLKTSSAQPARITSSGHEPDPLGGRAGRRGHSRGRHLLHEQHDDAPEPGAADHEVEGPRELAARQLRLRHPRGRRRAGAPEREERLRPRLLGEQPAVPRRHLLRVDLLRHHRQDLRVQDQGPRERPVARRPPFAPRCTTTPCSSKTTGACT